MNFFFFNLFQYVIFFLKKKEILFLEEVVGFY